jgi:glucokinase
LGWAIAQVLTIAAPQRVVIGGGVSLVGEPLFQRLRETVGTFVFPPLANDFELVPASLGEETVVVGAVELARTHGVSSVA